VNYPKWEIDGLVSFNLSLYHSMVIYCFAKGNVLLGLLGVLSYCGFFFEIVIRELEIEGDITRKLSALQKEHS